ncbi:MAG: crossover junction endodeoxyribonuclease RuvC [Patescibacteria group bacterium]|nr:crossover junction endodeoxyribonuclease RuvC [Patescibacteria group bacterium]MDD5715964.1 crossover junction endodeoxyribonuclease RuvC [Patescibacteria group bacterium]
MQMPKRRIIMGIDPGFAITGYGIIQLSKHTVSPVQYGAITSSAREPYGQRLEKLYRELTTVIKRYKPDTIAVEKLFFSKNVTTALKVGEARGIAMLAASQSGAAILEFTPLQIKQAMTGYGRAGKAQIQKMVEQSLCLGRCPKPDDIADALAIAICGAYTKDFSRE